MNKEERLRVVTGRQAVDAYRLAHAQLYQAGWHQGIPKEHTPLLDDLLAELERQGSSSLDQLFNSSQELNIEELGFESKDNFEARATEAEREALDRMWH